MHLNLGIRFFILNFPSISFNTNYLIFQKLSCPFIGIAWFHLNRISIFNEEFQKERTTYKHAHDQPRISPLEARRGARAGRGARSTVYNSDTYETRRGRRLMNNP